MSTEWNDTLASWQDQTSSIPSLVRDHIIKSRLKPEDAAQGLRSLMYDPLSIQYAMGYKDRRYSVTYDVLKRIPHQVAVVSAILQTRCNQVAAFSVPYRSSKSVGYVIKHKDPSHLTTKSEQEFIKDLERFIYNCGYDTPNPYNNTKRDDFESFLKKTVRDSLMYDQMTFELVPDRRGQPYEFMAVDAATIRIAAPDTPFGPNNSWHKRSANYSGSSLVASNADTRHPYRMLKLYERGITSKSPDYVQILNGQIENVYDRSEMVFGVRNPRTDIYIQGYGYGELEQLVTIVTAHLYAEEYNRRFFSQSSAPKGILNFKGDAMTPDMLEAFRRQWRSNLEGVENCLAGDTRIYTRENGFSSLSSICGDKKEVPVHIWTGTSWETGLVYKTKEDKVLCHTKLDNGVTISTSPDHKIKVVGESGDPEWKTQDELVLGDVLLVNREDTAVGTTLGVAGKRATPEFMEVLGWLIGDGYIGPRSVQIFYHHEKEQEILENHLSVIKEFFPSAEKHIYKRSEEQIEDIKEKYGFKSVSSLVTQIRINDVEVAKWFSSHGFTAGKKKVVPSNLFTMPRSHRVAFLRGIFSADGNNAKRRSPEITISADDIRDQIKHLLLSVGIRCALSEGKNKVVIEGKNRIYKESPHLLRVKDRDLFFDIVGFLQYHKQPKGLKKLNESNKFDKVPKSTIIKYLNVCRNVNKESSYSLLTRRERMDLNSILSGEDGCSRSRLIRYLEKCGQETPSWLNDYSTATVVELSNTGLYVPMFDVSVDHKDHMFVANNVLCSNSWRTPILQSEQGLEWIDLHPNNRDMEFGSWLEYLIKITCGVFLIDPAEINFDLKGGVQQTPLFESSQEWKLKASRDRGLKPLLRFISKLINEYVINKIDDHFVFDFAGLEELTDQEKHTLRTEQVSSYLTLNEIRRSDDLPDLEFGDIPMNPTYLQAMQQKSAEEQQKAQMEQQKAQAEAQQALTQPAAGEDTTSQGKAEDSVGAPQYNDSFGKSLIVSDRHKYLEIDLSELDSWKTSL
jgi:intein/homing endonuclease